MILFEAVMKPVESDATESEQDTDILESSSDVEKGSQTSDTEHKQTLILNIKTCD